MSAPLDDPRSPADFSRDWAAVARIQGEDERRRAGLALAPRWQGRRFEWEGFASASLCQREQRRCAVQIFNRATATDPDALGGFFPILELNDAGMDALRSFCGGKTSCVLRFRGVLAGLSTDPELPLGMRLVDVEVLGGRDPAPGEAWFKDGPSFSIPEDYQVRPLPVGNEPPLPPLKVKVVTPQF